jgi:dTDP-6-deoxy-L-talose 4-dehydrogenase (NAD+)
MDNTVLVTGAGGYIGRHVVEALLALGKNVIATDINTDLVNPKAVRIVSNIFDENATIWAKIPEVDVCIHMAWRNGFVHNADTHMQDLSQHWAFLKRLLDCGLKHLSVMGTMHEIGYYEGAINEDTACNPLSQYGIAKDALRRSTFLMSGQQKITLQWLRGYYIYGDDKYNNSIFAKIVKAAEDGQTEFPFTTGKNKYDFIHVTELARQIAAASVQSEVTGIIECCTGKPVSLAEQVENFIKEHNFNISLKYGAFPDRAYDTPAIWGDDTKIRRVI